MKRTQFVFVLIAAFSAIQVARAMTPDERRAYREKLLEILPEVPAGRGDAQSFAEWARATDALPPDFDALPKVNGLPDPFTFFDQKRKVTTPQDWEARRAEIRELFEKYIVGTIPPKPKLDQVIPVSAEQGAADAAAAIAARGRGFAGGARRGGARGQAAASTEPGNAPIDITPATAPAARGPGGGFARGGRAGGTAPGGGPGGFRRGPGPVDGAITRYVDLKYGPNSAITTRVTLILPPGNGPFPVLIGGGPEVTRRGYIACDFPSSVDAPPDLARFYPEYDFGSMGQIAFVCRMVVDYLYTLPEVDKPHIAMTGYSRGGKMALTCAAFEDRITAVIAGSTGVGGVLPWRYGSEANVAESIESTTRMFPIWYPKKFRFFSGREDRLPVDGNLMVDLIAPRAVLMLYGRNDEVSNTWGNEATYYDTLKVYRFLGKPDAVGILRIDGAGQHHGSDDPEGTAKWLDIQFGKSQEKWSNNFLFPWDWNQWKQKSGETIDPMNPLNLPFPVHPRAEARDVSTPEARQVNAMGVRMAVESMLGSPNVDAMVRTGEKVSNPGDEGVDDTPRWVIGRSIIEHGWTRAQAAGIATRDIHFGHGDIRGDFYFKQDTPPGAKLPAVIFLHGFSYPLGYMWVYRTDPHPILALANAGYAVLAYDQSGFGSRMNESASFYEKYPHWSQLGRMVEGARAAVAVAMKDPMVDPGRIYVFGYGVGGAVALHAAALDPNIKGVVSICGFTPMRTDTPDKGTGGIARFFETKPLLPRLGFFAGHESQIPYDYDELIATIAPRPVYLYNPIYNRDATLADARDAVAKAKKVFDLENASNKLVLDDPWDYFRLSLEGQTRIVDWMTKNMK
jgi:dienelactone hydrolase